MGKLTTKSGIRLLSAMSWLVYFSSYVTRINYGAILVEFIAAEGVPKSAASLITTVLFVTYGTGQLISGYLGDRVLPQKLIATGLLMAAGCNFLMPILAPNISCMIVIWGINGFAQALMWPPLVKILTSALTMEVYARQIPFINTSSACATIAIYLMAPMVIHVSGWKTVFFISGGTALAAAAFWYLRSKSLLTNITFPKAEKRKAVPKTEKSPKQIPALLLIPILFSIAVQGMLRDGISTWMPTFVFETFHTARTTSILTGVALPVFQMLINLCIYPILKKMKNDVFACVAALFFGAAVLLALLRVFGMGSILAAVLLLALSIGAVYGINALQTCYLPTVFQNSGNIASLAGLLNAATYVGSALSTYLFAAMSEAKGWTATLQFWCVLSVSGLLLTLICMKIHRNRHDGSEKRSS